MVGETITVYLDDEQLKWNRHFYTEEEIAKPTYNRGRCQSLVRARSELEDAPKDRKGLYTDGAVQKYTQEIENLSPAQVDDEFWSQFNEGFIARIDKLTEKKPALISEGTKCVVVLPAMNEVNLERMYGVLRENHENPENFEKEVVIVCYHNFFGEKEKITPEVLGTLERFSKNQNVIVVEESVNPEEHSVHVAKTVASCAALRLKPKHLDIPFLFVDADLEGFSEKGMAMNGTQKLSGKDAPWLLSAGIDYSAHIELFPTLAEYFKLRRFIAESHVFRWPGDILVNGAFLMMNSKKFQLVGGFAPTKNVPENRLLAEAVDTAGPPGRTSFTVLPANDIVLYPDKEILSTLVSGLPEARYLPENSYRQRTMFREEYDVIGIKPDQLPQQLTYRALSGRLRIGRVLKNAERASPILEAEPTQKGLRSVVNTVYLEYKMMASNFGFYLDNKTIQKTRSVNILILRWLKARGINTIAVNVFSSVSAEMPLISVERSTIEKLETHKVDLNLAQWDGESDILQGNVIKIFTEMS